MIDKKSSTAIYGVLGWPAKHSLSPLMHNAAFKALSINAEYKIFEINPQGLDNFFNSLANDNILGLNVTVPYKETVLKYLHWVSPEASFIKAANTIIVKADGSLEGYNTDGKGFAAHLTKGLNFDPRDKKIILLGSGGAAKAVADELARLDARILYIYDKDAERSMSLSEKINKGFYKCAAVAVTDIAEVDFTEADIIINATPMGMKEDDPLLINPDKIHSGHLVYDLIYNPPETKLLKAAKLKGAKVSNGLGMLLYQGAASFELWTKESAPVEVMRQALKARS